MPKQKQNLASINHLIKLALIGVKGKDWYTKANEALNTYCDSEGISSDYFADIIAITSPRLQLSENIRRAKNYCDTMDNTGLLPSTISALNHYHETGNIRGPKTGPFARALKGDISAIVLDTHMAKAFKIAHKALYWAAHWQECLKRVAKAAKKLGWTPCETQAAIWHGAQGLIEPHYFEI